MGMNPDTNQFEELQQVMQDIKGEALGNPSLMRPDGSPVPKHWSVFTTGEIVVAKNYTFKVAYIGESTLLLEPVGPVLVGNSDPEERT